MSVQILPRTPAHSGFLPAPAAFAPAPTALAETAQAVCGCQGAVGKKLPHDASPEGYYRVECKAAPALFLKVVPKAYLARQNQAETIARALRQAGAPANAALDGYPRPWGEAHAAYAYPYIDARFADATGDDMRQLGSALGTLHEALAHLAQAKQIRDQASERQARIGSIRTALLSGILAPPGLPPALPTLLQQDHLSSLFQADGQPLHGDPNYGNVIFPRTGGPPLILDFEDAMFSYGAPHIDLALVIERFILVRETDDATALALGEALAVAYRTGRKLAGGTRPSLQAVLAGMAQRALCLLAEMRAAGRDIAAGEWDKFVFLHAQAQARAGLLTRLDGLLA